MNKKEIINLFIQLISSDHFLNEHVHYLRQHVVSKDVHRFIHMIAESLEQLDIAEPGYARRLVEWISTLKGNEKIQQNLATFAEVLVAKQVVKIADLDENSKPYFYSEPKTSKNSKNPEFRSKTNSLWYAIEVKTPSLFSHIMERQSGFQITTHLPDRDMIEIENIIKPKIQKVKDFLVKTQEKYEAYIKTPEYKEDYRLLFIVWDDYINEPISALLSPYCGLFTPNSFHKESNFNLLDGVFIIRHLHQFNRVLRHNEFINEIQHAFQWANPQLPVAFIQNPHGRVIPKAIIEKFEGVDPRGMIVAEYKPTDLVDWRTGIGITGLSSIPHEYQKNVFQIMKESTDHLEPRAIADVSNFSTLNLDMFVEEELRKNQTVNYELVLEKFSHVLNLAILTQKIIEDREKQYLEKEAEAIYNAQVDTLKKAMGIPVNIEMMEQHIKNTKKSTNSVSSVSNKPKNKKKWMKKKKPGKTFHKNK
jgi:hypothetical protein